jgi:cell division septum initiation protein DivIVA
MSTSDDPTTPISDRAASSTEGLPRRWRGYDRAATAALFDEVASKQAELELRCASLLGQIARLEDELARCKAQEELVAQTLVEATRRAAEIKENAQREADVLLEKAREESDRRAEEAERAERDRAQAEHQLLHVRKLAHEMHTGLAGFLTRAVEQLRSQDEGQMPKTPGGADDARPGTLETELGKEAGEHRPQNGDGATLRPGSYS